VTDSTFSLTVEVTRGTSTDDRDKFRATVEANTIEELEKRVDALRSKVEEWATDFRAIQPDGTVRDLADDQSTLGGAEA